MEHLLIGSHPDQHALFWGAEYYPGFYAQPTGPNRVDLGYWRHGDPEAVPPIPEGYGVVSTDAAYDPQPPESWDVDEWEAAQSYVYFAPRRDTWREAYRQCRVLAKAKVAGKIVSVAPLPTPPEPRP
jgi:hypothetical protein